MDTLSHALWPTALFPNKKWRWHAALWGILPDLGTIGPLWYLISQDGFRQLNWIIPFTDRSGIPYLTHTIPDIWMAPYHLLHSFIPFVAVAIIVSLITKRLYLPIIGMGIHIIFDMFLHSGKYATQFLFPLSNINIETGFGWQQPSILITNWGILFMLLVVGYFIRKKKKSNNVGV